MASVEWHKKECLEIEVFSKFLDNTFDTNDLMFFLYLRSLIEKELELSFTNLKEQNLSTVNSKAIGRFSNVSPIDRKRINTHEVDTRNIFLSRKECAKLIEIFFEELANSKDRLHKLFSEKKVSSPRSKEEYVNGSEFMLMMVMEFKRNRAANGGLSGERVKESMSEAVKPELER
eukprot:TRINITY_DN13226_c0_g1_i3.p2 TRINITY_DN13226_c0_g1~~TRINITY_DN13226_c0_g1_i3.p2  ORF type:complete len:175 (+),score=49.66 TRINITY_DN13226_c0_g1_i3:299-823(+)